MTPEQQGSDFGSAWVLNQVASDVREIRSKLETFATKTEMAYTLAKIEDFVPRAEIDKKFEERDARFGQYHLDIMEAIKEMREKTATKAEVNDLKERLAQGPIAAWLVPLASLVFSIIWTVGYTLYMHGSVAK